MILLHSDKQAIDALWLAHSGTRSETEGSPALNVMSIPRDHFIPFVEAVLAQHKRQLDWDVVADEMGVEYATKHRGPRPRIKAE